MWDLLGPDEAVCRDGVDAAVSKVRRRQGVDAIKEAAHQAADPAVGADGEGQEAHTGTEDGRDDLIARQHNASLFAKFTATLELQFLTVTKMQLDFIFLSNLRIGDNLGQVMYHRGVDAQLRQGSTPIGLSQHVIKGNGRTSKHLKLKT